MTMEHMDNFNIYGGEPLNMLNGVYAELTGGTNGVLQADPDGISPGWVLGVGYGGGADTMRGPRYVLNALEQRVGLGGRIWFPELPNGANGTPTPFIWKDVTNTPIACITVDSTGRITFRKGDFNAAAVYTTPNPVITANGWYHMEAVLDITADTFELRIEGVTKINEAGLALATDIAQIVIGTRSINTSAACPFFFKDFVCYNGDGAYNNTFIGTVIIEDLLPTADIALNWTPTGAANGYSILDNSPPDDTKYISAGDPPPAAYVAALSDLPIDVTSVKALMTMVRAAKTDGGDGNLQVSMISDPGGVPATVNGANRPITVAQTYWRDIFETDPKTAAPWLPAAVNLAQMKLSRTV